VDKETLEIGVKEKETGEELFQNGRRKNQNNFGIPVNGNLENESKKDKNLNFDNCNVYLKNSNNMDNNPNRPSSRKRSAFKFIESTLEKAVPTNITNSVKSTKDPINDKLNNLGAQFGNFNMKSNNQYNSQPNAGGFLKNSITSTNAINAINNTNPNEKKPEYQSRRKNQTTNILNELDNPKVVDININSNFSNKSEIDKIDHSNGGFRKSNNPNYGNNKEMIVADNNYKKNSGLNNFNTQNDTGLGLFNSRRHVNNSNQINSLGNSNINNNKAPIGKDSNKDRSKFLII
jgi:hypothetical protein